MVRCAAALLPLVLAALLSTAAAQAQALPAPAAARDPANVFHWDTLSLGQAPAAAAASKPEVRLVLVFICWDCWEPKHGALAESSALPLAYDVLYVRYAGKLPSQELLACVLCSCP